MKTDTTHVSWPEVFSALASEPRLRIVELLSHGRVQCQEILAQLDLSQPAISYHLSKLERAGVLRKERQGTRNCYQLREEVLELVQLIRSRRED